MRHEISKICMEDTCPICGGRIVLGSDVKDTADPNAIGHTWNCPGCGARGLQHTYTVFAGTHSAVQDRDGNDIIIHCPTGGRQPGVAYHAILRELPSEGRRFCSDGKSIFCKEEKDTNAILELLRALGIFGAEAVLQADGSYQIMI